MSVTFLYGNHNDNVPTPRSIYNDLNKEFDFDFDPCPLKHDITQWDGLQVEWGRKNFVNPPFSNIPTWVKKALVERDKGKVVVMLLTARLNAKYWHDLVLPNASEIRFYAGKIKFNDKGSGLPTPVAAVVFDQRKPTTELGGGKKYKYYKLKLC